MSDLIGGETESPAVRLHYFECGQAYRNTIPSWACSPSRLTHDAPNHHAGRCTWGAEEAQLLYRISDSRYGRRPKSGTSQVF